jgi:hypothetical protein
MPYALSCRYVSDRQFAVRLTSLFERLRVVCTQLTPLFEGNMKPESEVLTLTKIEGATRQTDAAIEAFWRGDLDIAITLAGAAEGMIEREGDHLFSYLRDSPRVRDVKSKQWIDTLNQERDWLKHVTPQLAPVLEIRPEHAAIMIARAASKIEKWSPKMDAFKLWLLKNIESMGDETMEC